jgi:hypothetical protein
MRRFYLYFRQTSSFGQSVLKNLHPLTCGHEHDNCMEEGSQHKRHKGTLNTFSISSSMCKNELDVQKSRFVGSIDSYE